MVTDRIEGKWIDCFARVFALCRVAPGEPVAILSETQSRGLNVALAELALLRLGARVFHVVVPTPPQTETVPVRSTGASDAVQRIEPVVKALASAGLVVDCTVEGMLHAPELPDILKGGARLFMISNEHPEVLERTMPTPELRAKVQAAGAMLGAARDMRVTSPAGTDLRIRVAGAPVRASGGIADEPGRVAYWPAGLCLCFPLAGSVDGRLVMAAGDVNLTFKRYLESPVALTVESDYVTAIEGDGVDAALMRSYIAAWGDREAYAVSHVGWGMNPAARWDSMVMYDKRDINGSELRAFAGNFLYSTGANEHAGRFTKGHFDLPLRGCTIALDGAVIVRDGVLEGALA
jgi:2,5-dihydroxypyridine 5,6-dioxygenase